MTLRLLATALLASAGSALGAEQIAPIEQEPQHLLRFQNQFVRLFDVQLPCGYKGLWHSHIYDGVFVNIEATETRAQDLGADIVVKWGRREWGNEGMS